ncbi:hypothetical protein [Pseudactinotalea sp. Z1732]|uniref:hypothetical protein n=1 Tax=Micrococcales TaxID=85006 RepID=UPI003C7C3CC9
MDRTEALTWLETTVKATTPPELTEPELDGFLDVSRIVDADGRAPVDEDYEETFDLNHAAALAFEAKAVASMASDTGGIESFTSEGSAFRRRAGTGYAGFMALADRYRAKSAQNGGITVIEMNPLSPLANPRSAFDGVTTNAD